MVETIAALNNVYKNESALYELQFENDGFEWVDTSDYEKSILSWLRKDSEGNVILVLANSRLPLRKIIGLEFPSSVIGNSFTILTEKIFTEADMRFLKR